MNSNLTRGISEKWLADIEITQESSSAKHFKMLVKEIQNSNEYIDDLQGRLDIIKKKAPINNKEGYSKMDSHIDY